MTEPDQQDLFNSVPDKEQLTPEQLRKLSDELPW